MEEHPELKEKKRGFPNLGKRQDKKEYSNGVKNIEEAWKFYDIELYSYNNKNKIVNLGTGNPIKCKPFPGSIKSIRKKLKTNLYDYQAAAGDENDRKKIAEYLIAEGFKNDLSFDNVIITNSTTESFKIILETICNPHDVVIMTSPTYGLFTFIPERINIDVRFIELKECNDYKLDSKELKKIIIDTNKELKEKYKNSKVIPCVKAFLNTNPHNPLGTVMTEDDLDLYNKIGNICIENNVFIIDDLIYRDLTFDRKKLAKPFGTIDNYFDNTISIFGLSKSYGLAKTRSGMIVAHEVLIRGFRDKIFHLMDSASSMQSALLEGAYNNSKYRKKVYKKYFDKIIKKYTYNRDLVISLIDGYNTNINNSTKIKRDIKKVLKEETKLAIKGIPFAKTKIVPQSGYFILIDFSDLKKYNIIKSEKALLEYLYLNANVKFLVGQSFLWPKKDEMIIRISFSLEKRELIQVLYDINKAIRSLKYETNRNNYESK